MSTPSETPSRSSVLLALGAVYVVWGSTYLVMRFALEGFPPFIMGGFRFLLAGGLMYGFLRLRGAPRPSLRQWGNAFIVGTLLLAVGNGLVGFAEQYVASSLAAVMVASMPLFAAVFSGLFGRWPGRREWLGLAVGGLGVVFLNLDGDLRANVLGAIALIVAPAAWAFGSVWSRKLDMPKGAMSSAAQMLSGGLVMAVAGALFEGPRFHAPPVRSVASLLYLVVFGSIIGFSAYQWLLRNVRPALATSYAYVNPVVAVALGVMVGGEALTRWGVAGAALVVAAVALVALSGPKRPAAAKEDAPVPTTLPTSQRAAG